MGYHKQKIQKGELGHFSKIKEEFEELDDAYNQSNPILELCECADLIGAIEQYCLNHYDIELIDLIQMKDSTKSAFESGERDNSNELKMNLQAVLAKLENSESPFYEGMEMLKKLLKNE